MKKICPLIKQKCIEEKCLFAVRCHDKGCKGDHCLVKEGLITLAEMYKNFEGDDSYIG